MLPRSLLSLTRHGFVDAMAGLAEGRGLLLQGGDCAESFDDPVAEQVAGIVGLFDTMAEAIEAGNKRAADRSGADCRPVRQAAQRPGLRPMTI